MTLVQRRLGSTGISVSLLGLGTVKFGRNAGVKYPGAFELPSDAGIAELLNEAKNLGINLIDTAPAYGSSETRIGEILKQRSDWIISTKVGEKFEQGQSSFDFSATAARESVSRSLDRLQTDYLDVVMIHTNDDDLAHFIRGIVNHGMYTRYYHDVVGVNSRLDALQAAVLKVKLQYLDFYNERRKEAAIRYTNYFKNHDQLITPFRSKDCDSHVFHQYTLRLLKADRDALVAHLNKHQIPCGVYYPVPLHAQKAYADPSVDPANFPVTNQLVKEVISLPMHSELTTDQIEYVASTLLDFFN